jgi:hypothetical protein
MVRYYVSRPGGRLMLRGRVLKEYQFTVLITGPDGLMSVRKRDVVGGVR